VNFFEEVWRAFRPYLVRLTIDFLVSASLWVALFIFKILTNLIQVPGWAGIFIVNLHSAGIVAALFILVFLFVVDIAQIRREK